MLKNLYINNFAIIKEIDLKFSEGLNVFTGETGAGKSIVIEALSFALGARADFGLIGNNSDKLIVKAAFSTNALPQELQKKYNITKEETTEFEYSWEWLYGKLPVGTYRLTKGFMDFRETGDYDPAVYWVEFVVE